MLLNARIKTIERAEDENRTKKKRRAYLILVEGQMSRLISLRIVSESINNIFVEATHPHQSVNVRNNVNSRSFVSFKCFSAKLCSELIIYAII